MRHRLTFIALTVLLGLAATAAASAPAALAPDAEARVLRDTRPLPGEWQFRLDPDKKGVAEKWFDAALPDKITLPGSTDEAGYGTKNTRPADFKVLSRLVEYTGAAWYAQEIDVPAEWKGKRVALYLERCHWESQVWLDGKPLGMQDSLCVPHLYELGTDLAPGKHRLAIRIDNTKKYNLGDDVAHSVSEQTQTNWNGIIGRIGLRATDPVWVEDIQVYPDVDKKSAKVRVTIGNATGKPAAGTLELAAVSPPDRKTVAEKTVAFKADGARTAVEADVPMGDDVKLWDEFSPALYRMVVTLTGKAGDAPVADLGMTSFGMRKFTVTPEKQFSLNGRPVFLRGTLECCIFPLTGYPPMDTEAWLRIVRIAKSYGLNHLRFHSWCPPEAAFRAADQEGFILHVESPVWVHNLGKDAPRDAFIGEEWRRIQEEYGNHPSFALLCVGNELRGDAGVITPLLAQAKRDDPRRLVLSSAASDNYLSSPENQYNSWQRGRGLHGPATNTDLRSTDAKSPVPVISHEIGQWTVYPNFDEIKKYTGVLRARNFELVRDNLKAKGMLDQAPAFVRASGALMVSLYKEEIEAMLRTPNHGGFQLLDLHDFPGQGTALIGVLDPFWDSKGLITPEAWRRFCGVTVPLARLPKRTYTADETLVADVELSHFGPAAIENASPVWTLKDAAGREVAAGTFEKRTLPTGKLSPLGKIEVALAKAPAPAKLTLTVALKGTEIANDWDLWVYPTKVDTTPPAGVTVVEAWDDAAKAALEAGGRVLLLASARTGKSIPGSFTSVFWSPIWFPGRGAQTMSVLCDPKHPALALFPTENHTNWQWYDLLVNSRSMILDATPVEYRPIVQMGDNFSRNHKLGNLFEAQVGKGRLLVSSIDLKKNIDQRPAARQFLASVLAYMASDAFKPAQALDAATLDTLFAPAATPAGGQLKAEAPKTQTPKGEAPKAADGAVLHVKAAVNVPENNKAFSWDPAMDKVLAQQKGFDYSVRGGTWRDKDGASWHDVSNLVVRITCPAGFEGKLYVHFHDWNDLKRTADVFFMGREQGELRDYAGAGVWLAFPVTAKDTAKGVIDLSAKPTRGNAQITEIVLVK